MPETLTGQRLPFDLVRPAPPPKPAGFAKMVELGLALELLAEGGWWEVELLGVTGGSWLEPLPFDPTRELGVGSRVQVSKKGCRYMGVTRPLHDRYTTVTWSLHGSHTTVPRRLHDRSATVPFR